MRDQANFSSNEDVKSYDVRLRLAGAAGLVMLTDVVLLRTGASRSSLLLSFALVVLLATRLCQRQGALLASGIAAFLAAYNLPPEHTLGIDPSYRCAYGLFVGACGLMSLFCPPYAWRSVDPNLSRLRRKPDTSKTAYTEMDLPTIATPAEMAIALQTQADVEGEELYGWIRSCAHLSDHLWNVEAMLREKESGHAEEMLREARQMAVSLRRQMQQAGTRPKGTAAWKPASEAGPNQNSASEEG